MKESFNKRHLNDIWRVPMKRPSPHSEVGPTEQKPGVQDSISSWSRGGGTKLMTSSYVRPTAGKEGGGVIIETAVYGRRSLISALLMTCS